MRVLLDTHVLLWFQAGDPALPKEAERLIRSGDNEAYVSMVSLWEIGLKHGIGKLPLHMPLDAFLGTITEAHFRILPLERPHIVAATALPLHHRAVAKALWRVGDVIRSIACSSHRRNMKACA